MFAKVDAVDALENLLGRECMVMTPAIRDEIAVPLQYGYTFSRKVPGQISVASLTDQVQQRYGNRSAEDKETRFFHQRTALSIEKRAH
jgi:hypothetical protein